MKLGANNFSLAHLTLILSLHYHVKCRSRSLAVYGNEFILGSACVGSKITETTKLLKICYMFSIYRIHFRSYVDELK